MTNSLNGVGSINTAGNIYIIITGSYSSSSTNLNGFIGVGRFYNIGVFGYNNSKRK